MDKYRKYEEFTWPNGDKYCGKVLNGKFDGFGTYTWVCGEVYEGNWSEGKRNGKGTHVWPDGETYSGDWLDGKKHGQGRHVFPDGREFEGEYKFDRWDGFGILTSKHSRYEGEWKNGVKWGKGLRTHNNITEVVVYEDGVLISATPAAQLSDGGYVDIPSLQAVAQPLESGEQSSPVHTPGDNDSEGYDITETF